MPNRLRGNPVQIKFWGVRGSIATPGDATKKYGGNTACTELTLDDGNLIILDAGTGIRTLGEELIERGGKVSAYILITHPHWDHIQGFPFFRPAFMEGNFLTIAGPEAKGLKLKDLIAGQMDKVYFPVRLSELEAEISFVPLTEGTFKVFDAEVESIYVNHPGFTLGYRITYGGKTLVYISDNEPFSRESSHMFTNGDRSIIKLFESERNDPNDRIVNFVKGADVLIHDATYTPELYKEHVGWGHSDYLFTMQVAAKAGVKKLCLFHYDPLLDDEKLDMVVADCEDWIKKMNYGFELCPAMEGLEFTV